MELVEEVLLKVEGGFPWKVATTGKQTINTIQDVSIDSLDQYHCLFYYTCIEVYEESCISAKTKFPNYRRELYTNY